MGLNTMKLNLGTVKWLHTQVKKKKKLLFVLKEVGNKYM